MAYTTQKDVIKVGFLNETLDPTCLRKVAVGLKTYASTTDARALDSRRLKQAQFLADLVACRTYAGDQDVLRTDVTREDQSETRLSDRGDYSDEEVLSAKQEINISKNLPDVDSLLFRTNQKLTDIEYLLKENEKLKEELICSADELKKLNDENIRIKDILKNGDPSKIVEFENKVKTLIEAGRVDVNDIEELLKLRKQIGDRQKAIEILEAENNALKHLTEKLLTRTKIPSISIELETSTDVSYLQETINNLKQEIVILRAMEDEFTKMKIDFVSMKRKYDDMSEQQKQNYISKDNNQIKAIIDERNKLRIQLDKMIGIEGKIAMLKEKALKADQMEKELEEFKGGSIIAQQTLQDCRKKIENLDQIVAENAALKIQLDNYKKQNNSEKCFYEVKLNHLKDCIEQISCQLKKTECDNCYLKRRLQISVDKIDDYEEQMHQLMAVISELQNAMMSKIHEMKIFDSSRHELISTSKSCLQQIRKELELRCSLEKELQKYKRDVENLRVLFEKEKEKNNVLYREPQQYEQNLEFTTELLAPSVQSSTRTPSISNEEDLSVVSSVDKFEESPINVTPTEEKIEERDTEKHEYSPEESGIEHSEPDDTIQKLQMDLNNCRMTITDFKNKINILENELKSCINENSQLKEKNKILSSSSAVDNSLEEIENLKMELQKEKIERKVKIQEFDDLKIKFEDLKKKFEDLKSQLNEKTKIRFQVETATSTTPDFECEKLKDELENQKMQLDDVKNELEDHRKEINKYIERIRNLQKENDDYKLLNNKYEEQLREKNNEIEEAQSRFLELEGKLQNTLEENVKRVFQHDELKKAMVGAEENLKRLQKKIDDIDSENKQLKDLVVQKEEEINNLKEKILKDKTELEKHQSISKTELEKVKNEKNRLNEELIEKDQQIDKLNNNINNKDIEIKNIRERNERLHEELNKKEMALKNFEEEKNYLNNQIVDKNAEIHNFKAEKDRLNEQINKLTTEITNLKAERDRLNEQISKLSMDTRNFKDENDRLLEEINKKSGEIQDLKNSIERFRNDINNLKSELEICRKEKNELSKLIGEIEKERQKNNDLEKMLSNIETKMSEAPKSLPIKETGLSAEMSLQSAIDKLKEKLEDEKARNDELLHELKQCKEKLETNNKTKKEYEVLKKKFEDLKYELDEKIRSSDKDIDSKTYATIESSRKDDKKISDRKYKENKPTVTDSKDNENKHIATVGSKKQETDKNDNKDIKNKSSTIVGNKKLESDRNDDKDKENKAQEIENKPTITADTKTVGSDRGGRVFSGVLDMESIRITVDRALENLKKEHIASLRKLQDMHERQLRDLTNGHDKEIDALQKANEAMRNSLSNIRQKMETNACMCDKKGHHYDGVVYTKLQCICKKILDSGIECLSLSELTYLHTEVYKAGLKLKPELLKCANISNILKCCKCAGFACCLPGLPREKEKIFVERIVNLEKDVDNANKVLQYLKMYYDNRNISSPGTSSACNRERYQSFRPNDEINKLLKKASESKICSNKRTTSKRKSNY